MARRAWPGREGAAMTRRAWPAREGMRSGLEGAGVHHGDQGVGHRGNLLKATLWTAR
jgi:hypothetical protein